MDRSSSATHDMPLRLAGECRPSGHTSTLGAMSRQLSHPGCAGILPTSELRALLPRCRRSRSLPSPVMVSLCQGGTIAVVWTCVSPPLPFLSSSPLRPCPCPPHAQALTGWHCANLPPPSLSFVAHLHIALPPVPTLPSLSPLLVSTHSRF